MDHNPSRADDSVCAGVYGESMRTQAQLRVELKNETEALKNVLRTNREQLRWIRWAEKELVRLSKLIDRMMKEGT